MRKHVSKLWIKSNLITIFLIYAVQADITKQFYLIILFYFPINYLENTCSYRQLKTTIIILNVCAVITKYSDLY